MRAEVARHDRILREAVEGNAGAVVKSTGDGVLAAFGRPRDALRAAVEAQRRLTEAEWRPPVVLRVRMGLHAGGAEQRDGDYFGPEVNRAARLMSAAHGGQVLVSGVAADLLRSELDAGVSLRELGEHGLKDVA